MYAILRFLFPDKPYTAGNSWLLLAARIIFGGLLMSHGIAKWQNFDALSAAFPDPLGVGSGVSLALAIFGEVVCSVGFIAGLFYRLALIPMIFTMCVAFFAVHGGDPFAARELALAYLSVYVLMYAAGPGLYAADTLDCSASSEAAAVVAPHHSRIPPRYPLFRKRRWTCVAFSQAECLGRVRPIPCPLDKAAGPASSDRMSVPVCFWLFADAAYIAA